MLLECSSKGDKRFSASYSKIYVNGVLDSIENHYQKSKVFKDLTNGKEVQFNDFKKVKHIQYRNEYELIGFKIEKNFFDKKYLTVWYKSLWYKYFLYNKNLINVINKYDEFNDTFAKTNTLNSQADVVKQIRYKGINSLYEDIKEFLILLKER